VTDRILLIDYEHVKAVDWAARLCDAGAIAIFGASKRPSSGQRDVVGESSRRCFASIIGVMLFIGGKLIK
jgi:hypothetical protein